MDDDRYSSLSSSAVFGGLSKTALERLLDDASIVHRAAGEYFFLTDDIGDSLFLLESGEVDVVREHDGKEHILARLAAGECFGEMALVGIAPRSASVRAVCDCKALELSDTSIAKLAIDDLEQFTLLQMNLGREVARRLRKADERLL